MRAGEFISFNGYIGSEGWVVLADGVIVVRASTTQLCLGGVPDFAHHGFHHGGLGVIREV
jgi:hypothetical protein